MRAITRFHSLITALAISASLCSPAAAAVSQSYAQTVQQIAQALDDLERLAKAMSPYDAVFRRDPIRPLIDEKGEIVSSMGLQGGLAVQGIIWSGASSMVVVDDQLYKQGDTVGPYTIRQVLPNGVVVQQADQTLLIPLDRGISTPRESSQILLETAPKA